MGGDIYIYIIIIYVAYLLGREYNPRYGEEGFMIQPVRLNSTERL